MENLFIEKTEDVYCVFRHEKIGKYMSIDYLESDAFFNESDAVIAKQELENDPKFVINFNRVSYKTNQINHVVENGLDGIEFCPVARKKSVKIFGGGFSIIN